MLSHLFRVFLIAMALVLASGVAAQDADTTEATQSEAVVAHKESTQDVHGQADGRAAAGEGHEEAGEHAEEHGPPPPIFLVLPFALLLLMIATGPLFYAHHWHHKMWYVPAGDPRWARVGDLGRAAAGTTPSLVRTGLNDELHPGDPSAARKCAFHRR